MKRPKIPQGYSLSVDSLAVTLIDGDSIGRPIIQLRTDDEGGGAYLRMVVDSDDNGVSITADELDDLAGIGRWLVELHDSLNSEAPDAGSDAA